jgi:hypothetical protein
MKLILFVLNLLTFKACRSAPLKAEPIAVQGEAMIVIRDFPIAGSPIVHSFLQVWDGQAWRVEEKTHTQRADGSYLRTLTGWRERGRNLKIIRGEKARQILELLDSKHERESAWSYNPLTRNNSNGWIADLLEGVALDPDAILSKGAWGK